LIQIFFYLILFNNLKIHAHTLINSHSKTFKHFSKLFFVLFIRLKDYYDYEKLFLILTIYFNKIALENIVVINNVSNLLSVGIILNNNIVLF